MEFGVVSFEGGFGVLGWNILGLRLGVLGFWAWGVMLGHGVLGLGGWAGVWGLYGLFWGFGRAGFGFGCDEFWHVVLGSGVAQCGFVGWRVEVLGWGGHAGAWGVRFRGWMGVWGLECTHLGFGRAGLGLGVMSFAMWCWGLG